MAHFGEMNILDLYCGLGGWAQGFVEQGHNVTGYDIVDFSGKYPGRFVKADLLVFNDFPSADVVVASPPCTDFSKSSFPQTWKSVQRYPPDIPKALPSEPLTFNFPNIKVILLTLCKNPLTGLIVKMKKIWLFLIPFWKTGLYLLMRMINLRT